MGARGPPTDRDRALCRLEDATYAYRVPDELRSIQGLERRGENFRLDVLLRLARIRRRLLGSRLREAAAPFGGRELVAELEEIGTTLRGWVKDTSTLTDAQLEHRTRELDERERLVPPQKGVLTFIAGDDIPPVDASGGGGHDQPAGA